MLNKNFTHRKTSHSAAEKKNIACVTFIAIKWREKSRVTRYDFPAHFWMICSLVPRRSLFLSSERDVHVRAWERVCMSFGDVKKTALLSAKLFGAAMHTQ